MTSRTVGEAFLAPANTGVYDAFGRVRVSEPFNIYDTQFQYDVNPVRWGTILSGDGAITHMPNMSAVNLTVGTASGARCCFQSRTYHRYQPGKSQFILLTGNLGARKANVRRRMGYYDDENGIFLEQTSEGLFWVRRSKTSGAVVEERVAQSNWNLDQMLGLEYRSPASDTNLDETKAQLLVIDLQWLSVGRVRVGFDINGLIVYVHEFRAANVLTGPYMTTANLPLRYEIDNTGVAVSGSSLLAICSAVHSEGGQNTLGYLRSINSGTTAETVSTREPVLAIRPKLLFNSIPFRGQIRPRNFEFLASGDLMWELVVNPTLTGASWASVGADSAAEYDTSATSLTGGTVLLSGYKSTGSGVVSPPVELENRVLGLDPSGATADILCLALTSLGGNISAHASMNWYELR